MVDWGTQDRLYPPGYQSVDIRLRRIGVDSSLPYSVATNKRHNCRSKAKQPKKSHKNDILMGTLQNGLKEAFDFYNNISTDPKDDDRHPKLIATYTSNINWPRSVCCLSRTDGSLIICEQEGCRLLLFTSQLMLRSTCGGKRGNGLYEFDSPWSIASLLDNSSSNILVADTNNRRVQYFTIGYNEQFLHKHTFKTKEKPYFVATSDQHFAISCEKGIILCFSAKQKIQVATVDLNTISFMRNPIQIALPFCMDAENSFLFISNPISSVSMIHQLTISGEYIRCIKLDNYPFLRISSLIFDTYDEQLIIVDSFNSVIYSFDYDLDENNVEILLKRSDNVNSPQALCIGKEGHLIVVECSVTTQHALKIFRFHPCECHSRVSTSSVKTSETTSVRSMIFPY